jgi:hypothetical protein
MDPRPPKYVCAPWSNCKGRIREILAYHGRWEKYRILYGGLVELIVNAHGAWPLRRVSYFGKVRGLPALPTVPDRVGAQRGSRCARLSPASDGG